MPFTLTLLVALAAACSGTASGEQTVISATVYPSSQGSVSHPSAGLQALGGCPGYDGSNPIYLYPAGQRPAHKKTPVALTSRCPLKEASVVW